MNTRDLVNMLASDGAFAAVVGDHLEIYELLQRISVTLAEFYRAPLLMASVQPVLDLAVELNPGLLKEKK